MRTVLFWVEPSFLQVRTQDIAILVQQAARPSLDRRKQAWRYITMQMQAFKKQFGGSDSDQRLAVLQMLANLSAGFASAEDYEISELFFRTEFPSSQGGLPRFVLHALDEIRRNITSKKLLESGLCKWLEGSK